MLEDFLYDFSFDLEALDRLIFYNAYDLHHPRTFGTCERIDLIYLLDKARPALSEFPGPDRSFLMDMYKVRLGIVRSL